MRSGPGRRFGSRGGRPSGVSQLLHITARPVTGPRHRRKGPELVSATQNRIASACLSQTPRFGRINLGVDHPREACSVWAPGEPVANLGYNGLYALQHCGQESASMAVADGRGMLVYREMGAGEVGAQ
jgi:hypothetical protein